MSQNGSSLSQRQNSGKLSSKKRTSGGGDGDGPHTNKNGNTRNINGHSLISSNGVRGGKGSGPSKLVAILIVGLTIAYVGIPDDKLWAPSRLLHRYIDLGKEALFGTRNKASGSSPTPKYLATVEQHFAGISMHEVNCSYSGYKEEAKLGAAPLRCGTLVSDTVVTVEEAKKLRNMAARLTGKLGVGSVQERESLNLKWVELYNAFRRGPPEGVMTKKDYELLVKTSEAVKHAVSVMFGVPADKLYFSHISEFTRYKPMLKFQEFLHVDKIRAPALVITAIVWLGTVEDDFLGGKLEFLTGGPEPFTPLLIEPKLGRFSAWTSSYENPHGVQEVKAGERLALVIGFTVFPEQGHKTLEDMFDIAVANYYTV